MADVNLTADLDTAGVDRKIADIQKSFDRLKSSILGLGIGAAFGAAISNAIAYADAIGDITDATGIATDVVLGFSRAVSENGGSAEGAQKAILKLVGSIEEAASGSKDAQDAFGKVGVSIKDLRTLSEQDILAKTIKGLGNLSDAGQRSAIAAKLLGKEFRGVGIQGVAGQYDAAVSSSGRYASAIESAAAAQGQLDKTINNFRIALLNAIKPFLDLATQLEVTAKGFERFLTVIITVVGALASFFIISKVVTLFGLLYKAILAVGVAIGNLGSFFAALTRGFAALWRATEGVGGVLARLLLSLKAIGVVILEALLPAFTALKPVILASVATAVGVWAFFQETMDKVVRSVKEAYNAFVDLTGIGTKFDMGDSADEAADTAAAAAKAAEAEKARREVIIKSAQEMAKFRLEQNLMVQSLSRDLVLRTNRLDNDNKLFIKNGQLLNVSEDQIAIERLKIALYDEQLSKIEALEDQIQKLQLDQKLGLDPEAGAKIKIIEENIKKINEAYEPFVKNQVKVLETTQTIKILEQDRVRNMENFVAAVDAATQRQQTLNDLLKDAKKKAADVKFEGLTIGMGPLERQIEEIKKRTSEAAQEAAQAFAASFDTDEFGMTPERVEELSAGLDAIASAFEGIGQAQLDNLEASRTWGAGWSEAFRAYAEEAGNAAAQARTYFETFSSGFENVITDLVTKGKADFRGFAMSIIADFAKIQAQKMIAQLFGGGGKEGGGGLLGGLFGGLFGKAGGGGVNANQPYMVGEAGKEMFVPNSAGKIVPNNELSASQPVQVTYNIQAVDASSFKSLVARDPSFIYAVSEAGRRGQPQRRGG